MFSSLYTLPSLTVGGRVFYNREKLITLQAIATSTNNSSFRKHNGSSGYQVTAGKTLYLLAWRAHNYQTSSTGPYLLYSDNDLGVNTNTVPTNPVNMCGSNSNFGGIGVTGVVGVNEGTLYFTIPAAKYVGMASQGTWQGGVVVLYGYEG